MVHPGYASAEGGLNGEVSADGKPYRHVDSEPTPPLLNPSRMPSLSSSERRRLCRLGRSRARVGCAVRSGSGLCSEAARGGACCTAGRLSAHSVADCRMGGGSHETLWFLACDHDAERGHDSCITMYGVARSHRETLQAVASCRCAEVADVVAGGQRGRGWEEMRAECVVWLQCGWKMRVGSWPARNDVLR